MYIFFFITISALFVFNTQTSFVIMNIILNGVLNYVLVTELGEGTQKMQIAILVACLLNHLRTQFCATTVQPSSTTCAPKINMK